MRHLLRHILTTALVSTSFFTWSAAHGAQPAPISIEQAKSNSSLLAHPVLLRACILLPMDSQSARSNHVLLYPCGRLQEVDAQPEQLAMLAEIMSEAAIQPFLDAGISIDNTKEVQADFVGELEQVKEKPDSKAEVMLKIRSTLKPQWFKPW